MKCLSYIVLALFMLMQSMFAYSSCTVSENKAYLFFANGMLNIGKSMETALALTKKELEWNENFKTHIGLTVNSKLFLRLKIEKINKKP